MARPKYRDGRARGLTVPKRTVAIAGRKTSVTLEDEFWRALKEIPAAKSVPVSELISTINRRTVVAIA